MDLKGAQSNYNRSQYQVGTSGKNLNALDTWGLQSVPKIALKVTKTAKNALFLALLKPLQTLYGSHGKQKQLNYMPVPNMNIMKSFKCIRYMRHLIVGLKQAQKWQNTANMLFPDHFGAPRVHR